MVTIQQIMSVLSSTVHLHLITKSQILLERSTHSSVFSMVYMKTSELVHLTGTVNSSWDAVRGRCSGALAVSLRVPQSRSLHGAGCHQEGPGCELSFLLQVH